MRGARHLTAAMGLGVLAACGLADRADSARDERAAAAAPGKSTAEDLLAYLASMRGASESALAAEAARQKHERGDLARVKAALALTLSPQSDDAEITALAEGIARKEDADRDLRAMAAFVHALAAERRRLRESAAAALGRVRDERRTADAQKQRADALQQKLDALTDLEKSLSDRPDPNR